jgi:hypothetical protein
MNINTAVEIVPDTSLIVGYIKEIYGEEKGYSFSCIEAIKERRYHTIRISKAIREECVIRLNKDGKPSHDILKMFFGPLEQKNKLKRFVYDQEEIEVNVSVPEHDRHVAETAVAVRNKYQRIPVFLVTKNIRDFNPEAWREKYDIFVMRPEEYVADP